MHITSLAPCLRWVGGNSESGIFQDLADFSDMAVQPRWLVIDDGWQRTTNDDALNTEQWDERLVGLEANKRFRYLHFSVVRCDWSIPCCRSGLVQSSSPRHDLAMYANED